jgi:drug/metabolite transporter (DMT)-like permease
LAVVHRKSAPFLRMSAATANAVVVGSEATLSLYPILIKAVPTNLTTQLLSRFLTFSVLAAVLATKKDLLATWGTMAGAARSAGLGAITLAHVAASYTAFAQLPAGVAMSLFYTYPFWNLLGGALGFGETVTSTQIALTVLAFVGVLLVSFGSQQTAEGAPPGTPPPPIRWGGIAAALAAALTESAMYFGVRTAAQPDPYYATLELYPGALFGLLAFLGLRAVRGQATQVDPRPSVWGPMLAFNAIIGFVGYALRFWAIPRVSTATFGLLSFVGVVSSFLFGWWFAGEKPTAMTAVGAALISVASGMAEMK